MHPPRLHLRARDQLDLIVNVSWDGHMEIHGHGCWPLCEVGLASLLYAGLLFPISTSIVSCRTTDSCSQELSSASPISHLLSHFAWRLWDHSNLNHLLTLAPRNFSLCRHIWKLRSTTHACILAQHRYRCQDEQASPDMHTDISQQEP